MIFYLYTSCRYGVPSPETVGSLLVIKARAVTRTRGPRVALAFCDAITDAACESQASLLVWPNGEEETAGKK